MIKKYSTQELARRAEEALGIHIHITSFGRAYYFAEETGGYCWLTRDDLSYAEFVGVRGERRGDPENNYSLWCAGTVHRPMSEQYTQSLGYR